MNRLDAVNRAHDLARHADDEGIRRNDLVLAHEGPCGDDRAFADLRARQHRRVHADEDMVADLRAMHDSAVPDRHIVADDARSVIRHMKADEILHIRALADRDVIHIAARNNARPKARILRDAHIARKKHLRCDESLLINLRLDAMKFRAGKRIHKTLSFSPIEFSHCILLYND